MLNQELPEGIGACDMARRCQRKIREKNSRGNIEQLGNGLGEKQGQHPDEEDGNIGNGTLAACERNTGQHECRAKDDRGQRKPDPANEVWLWSQRRIVYGRENQEGVRTVVEAIHQQCGKQARASEQEQAGKSSEVFAADVARSRNRSAEDNPVQALFPIAVDLIAGAEKPG